MIRRHLFVLTCIIVSAILIISIYYWNDSGSPLTEGKDIYTYFIKIEAMDAVDYTLYVPIVFNYGTENPSEIMNSLTIVNANGNFEIINTSYGKALQIIGNGNISLQSRNEVYVSYAYPSMANYTEDPLSANSEYNIMVFCNQTSTNPTIKLQWSLDIWHDTESKGISISTGNFPVTLINGWNEVNVHVTESWA